MNDLVSVITPHFNNVDTLSETLESVANQNYLNYEHIIIDDCSTEVSEQDLNNIVGRYSRTKLICLSQNVGAGAVRNVGIKYARGRFIAFLDADDLWEPNKLDAQLKFMRSNTLDLCYTSYFLIDERGKGIGRRVAPKLVTYKDLLKCNHIGCLSAIYDTKHLGKIYMDELRKRQDLALWLKLIRLGAKVGGMDKCLASYRLSKRSLSYNKWKVLSYQWTVYRECEGIGWVRSLYYFTCYIWNGLKNSSIFSRRK